MVVEKTTVFKFRVLMTIQEFDNTALSTVHRNIPDAFNEAKHMGDITNYLFQWNSVEVNQPISTTEKNIVAKT